ncbi:hypothetical protein ODZ83_07330 [Acaricomes phytoseiuli]|nr:hypothetical protein [Acaricomes phytoseiuli]MCW1249994.1 hypothetical protein [Acaricomes phytoseiuli]
MNAAEARPDNGTGTPSGFSWRAALAWIVVGVPLLYGVLQTLVKVTALFQ